MSAAACCPSARRAVASPALSAIDGGGTKLARNDDAGTTGGWVRQGSGGFAALQYEIAVL